jgi:glutathione S-transferase
MERMTLIVGNKNYSSWSLRGYLALAHVGADFDEIVLPLDTEEFARRIRDHSPSGRVPALRCGDVVVWDSLAICEYLAERFPAAALWPADPRARARARSVSAEMHAGFAALRRDMPMNLRRSLPGVGHTREALADAARVMEIWRGCRGEFGAGGDFLFGAFSAADAMYAPVVTRFRTYAVDQDDVCLRYSDAVLALPAMRRWIEAARAESWVIERDER